MARVERARAIAVLLGLRHAGPASGAVPPWRRRAMNILRYFLLAANAIALGLILYSLIENFSRTGGLPTPRWAPIGITLIFVLNLIYLWLFMPASKAGRFGKW
jgi:hypothetical protein